MSDSRNEGNAPKVIRLNEYAPPDYRVETVELRFELDDTATVVSSWLQVRADYDRNEGVRPLWLDGEGLELLALSIDDRTPEAPEYAVEESGLRIHEPPEAFTLGVVTRIDPSANTALEGLYLSGGNFCTQCEAEGFRRITYFPDRSDVMAVYTTTIEAERKKYPVLLSNGNRINAGDLENGRHFVTWHDPFPKPSYLFALVAGDLACVEDSYTTGTGREVALRIYVQHGNEQKCAHAMAALKKAMAWDEEVYGREYDLDIYMIVAVDDFNMGAMENKGLNLFNSRYILANPETATDDDYVAIESVVAHEYFHNWSGNRVTCRDWFQLSLKEGFTVFRDQEFTADVTSRAVVRIGEVDVLRNHQFREDAGPMAHPVRPDSYVEINNFYTVTVYNKGAEVVRMIHTLLGPERFRKGSDLYFERYDGQAVTTDDFVSAMEDANSIELGQFRLWYSQAGTPKLKMKGHFDPESRTYTLTAHQYTEPTPAQPDKKPFHIPLSMGLVGRDGRDLALTLEGEEPTGQTQRVLSVNEAEQRFTFVNVAEPPVPSLLRGFSAPVKLEADLSDAELAFLMAHDNDQFNRWDAGQQLAVRLVLRLLEERGASRRWRLDPDFSGAFGKLLEDSETDRALIAKALVLPAEAYLSEFVEEVDPAALHAAREFLRGGLAAAHRSALEGAYSDNLQSGPYAPEPRAMGRRKLKNTALAYLTSLPEAQYRQIALEQFRGADNMTDMMAALSALSHTGGAERLDALHQFYEQWHQQPLVLDKWFSIQATSPLPGTFNRVVALRDHPDFNIKNPNRVRSLIGAFCQGNPSQFHREDGAAYAFLADFVLELDRLNPQVAARLMSPFTQWRRLEPVRRERMHRQLERVAGSEGISRDVYEIASKSLAV